MWAEEEAKREAPDRFRFEQLREEEDTLLLKAGFEPVESDDLWVKDCVCYGREAALQEAHKNEAG